MSGPLCFVLMPFGKKPGAAGAVIDFDAVYKELIGFRGRSCRNCFALAVGKGR